jgi:hypothetical protein
MTVGIPGAGIGGLFYLIAALLLPVRSLIRRLSGIRVSWKEIVRQVGLALGILLGIWATGWLLGSLIAPARAASEASAGRAMVPLRDANIVLLTTQAARFLVRRKIAPVLIFVFLLFGRGAVPAFAQSPAADLLKKADAAFTNENRALAEKLYLEVIALDPSQSRAFYRLGVLAADDAAALDWFLRYIEKEPEDAWGWLAVGDRSLNLDKTVEALIAYERAARLAPTAADIQERLAKGRLRAAPAVEPIGGLISDSDGNRTWRYGGNVDFALRGGFRLGARLSRSTVDDGLPLDPARLWKRVRVSSNLEVPVTGATLEEAVFRLTGRPGPALRLDLTGGLARLQGPNEKAWSTIQADVRLRWRGSKSGPAFEARGLRIPLAASSLLVANRGMKDELRLNVDIPLGPLRFRGGGRAGSIIAAGEQSNARFQGDAALVLPLGWSGEISAQYHRLGFARASTSGYFAPSLVETIEAGTYWEWSGDGAFGASLDLGAGPQRLAKQNEALGPWKLALRGWASLSWAMSPAWVWRVEAEAYSAPFAPVGAATSADWRYLSVSTGLIIRIR